MMKIELQNEMHVLVDRDDYELVSGYTWYAHWQRNDWYAAANVVDEAGQRRTVLMHRLLMNADIDELVDHRNGQTLDNRRENLRKCTRSQNKMNAKVHKSSLSGFKGVTYQNAYRNRQYQWKVRRPWRARITVDGVRMMLGSYETAEDAARAYDTAAKTHFGEFARTNFPITET